MVNLSQPGCPAIVYSGVVQLTWQDTADLFDTAPGMDQKVACQVLADMGLNMRQFTTADHLAAWGGLTSGNRQSGGKRFHARIRLDFAR